MEPIKDDPINKLTFELAEEFDYLRQCFWESLRIEPPVANTFMQSFTRDVQIRGVTINSEFQINPDYMHHDPAQW